MIVDCGGGTVDITVLEAKDDGTFAVVESTGNDMGSTRIDAEFELELNKMFGRDTMIRLKVSRARV